MYYSKLTVYKFSKGKLKIDYSTIPITIESFKDGKPEVIASEVSDQKITLNKKPYFKVKDSYTVSLISEEFDESKIVKTLQENFNKHFWYKFGYKKFLNNKVKYIK